jgi:DNA-binding transcriptional LysR family regulator
MKFELNGLSLERLLTFCAVVEAGSIKMAAKGDPTRQSQFSRQIKELEEALTVKLFDRNGKHLTLNESGRKVALLAQSFLEELHQVRAANGAVVVSIGAAESVLRWVLFPKLDELGRQCPQARFEFQNLRTLDAISRVQDGTLHFGLVREDAVPPGLESYLVAEMRYALAVPRVILPQGRAEDVFLLRTLPIGILSSDGRLKQGIEDLARAEGFSLNVKMVADSFALLIEAAPRARCAVVMPAAAANELPSSQFAVISPEQFQNLTRRLCIISNPKVLALRSTLRRVGESLKRVLPHPVIS